MTYSLHVALWRQGSLVDDDSVIEVLNITKSTAAEVSEKLTVAADTEIKINVAREEFRPSLCRITAMCFFHYFYSCCKQCCKSRTSFVRFEQ